MIQMEGFSIEHEKPTRDLSCLDHMMLKSDCIQTEVELHKLRMTDQAVIISLTSDSTFLKELGSRDEKNRVNENKFMKIFRSLDWRWVKEVDTSPKLIKQIHPHKTF